MSAKRAFEDTKSGVVAGAGGGGNPDDGDHVDKKFKQVQGDGDEDDDDDDEEAPSKRAGRRKIKIEYIEDKSRRHITFSKRKSGIMKKVTNGTRGEVGGQIPTHMSGMGEGGCPFGAARTRKRRHGRKEGRTGTICI